MGRMLKSICVNVAYPKESWAEFGKPHALGAGTRPELASTSRKLNHLKHED